MKQKNRKLNHLQRGIIQILEFRKFQIRKTINFPDHVFQKIHRKITEISNFKTSANFKASGSRSKIFLKKSQKFPIYNSWQLLRLVGVGQ